MILTDSGRWRFASVLIAILLGSGIAAQEPAGTAPQEQQPESVAPQEPQKPKAWAPPEPEQGGWDWIQLTSGEWLKGELIAVRDGTLEFDSDEMDYQSFDLKDVAVIRSPRRLAVVRPDRSVLYGSILVRDDKVSVVGVGGTSDLERDAVLSIVPEGEHEIDLWGGDFSVGLTAQRGNTNQSLLKIQAELVRRSAHSRTSFRYIGNIGETASVQNVNNHRFDARWDLFVSRSWFLTPLALEVYKDKFQNIDYQALPAVGAGYHAIGSAMMEWDLTLGAGWRYTRYDSVTPPASIDEDMWVVIPGTRFNWDITSDLDFDLIYQIQIGVPETQNTNQHLVAKLNLDLTGNLELSVTFQWDRIGNPQPNEDGIVPVNDDFSTSVGLGWDF